MGSHSFLPTSFGEQISAGEQVSNFGNETRNDHCYVQDGFSYWIPSSPTKTKDAVETVSCRQRLMPPSPKPGRVCSDSSKGFHQSLSRASRDARHGHSSSLRNTNGITERASRRVEEGTETAMVQSDLPEWWKLRVGKCFAGGTCTTRWPMARKHVRQYLVYKSMDF